LAFVFPIAQIIQSLFGDDVDHRTDLVDALVNDVFALGLSLALLK
jgi:hypothetical protein